MILGISPLNVFSWISSFCIVLFQFFISEEFTLRNLWACSLSVKVNKDSFGNCLICCGSCMSADKYEECSKGFSRRVLMLSLLKELREFTSSAAQPCNLFLRRRIKRVDWLSIIILKGVLQEDRNVLSDMDYHYHFDANVVVNDKKIGKESFWEVNCCSGC